MSAWFHVVFSHSERDPIAADEVTRLWAVRRVVELAGPCLVLWCLVDDHLHVVLACERRRAGIFARNLAQALPVPLAPAWIKEVRGRRYRRWLVDYLLLQVSKHALYAHPALWSGSCFLDLVGARSIPGFRATRLLRDLPRLRLRELHANVGLAPEPLAEASDQRLRQLGPASLVAASYAAVGAAPDGGSKEPVQVAARALACSTAQAIGLRLSDVAAELGIHASNARRLAKRAIPAKARTALRRRVTLEDRLRGAPLAPPTAEPAGLAK